MKVLSKPDITAWTYNFTCYTCKSELCADYNDLKYRTEKQYYSGGDIDDHGYYSDVDRYYVTCPVCCKESQLIPNQRGVDIPYLLQEKVKNDYKGVKAASSI